MKKWQGKKGKGRGSKGSEPLVNQSCPIREKTLRRAPEVQCESHVFFFYEAVHPVAMAPRRHFETASGLAKVLLCVIQKFLARLGSAGRLPKGQVDRPLFLLFFSLPGTDLGAAGDEIPDILVTKQWVRLVAFEPESVALQCPG